MADALDLRDVRSLLFVPGHRSDRFAKAAAAGPDCVCIDLEDAVAPGDRAAARREVLAFLQQQTPSRRGAASPAFGVRINSLHSADGPLDLQALRAAPAAAAFVMLAKTQSAAELQSLAASVPGTPLLALIETAGGLLGAAALAQAHPQVQGLMLGGADLAAELGCDFAWEPLLFARSSLVAAAATAQLACIDVPWLDVTDGPGLAAETRRAAALGFSGKALIHPSQVQGAHAAFAPAEAALERARRVVQAASQGDAAALLDGRLVDRPVVLSAQRLLKRAGLDCHAP